MVFNEQPRGSWAMAGAEQLRPATLVRHHVLVLRIILLLLSSYESSWALSMVFNWICIFMFIRCLCITSTGISLAKHKYVRILRQIGLTACRAQQRLVTGVWGSGMESEGACVLIYEVMVGATCAPCARLLLLILLLRYTKLLDSWTNLLVSGG